MELSARFRPNEGLGGRVLKVNHAGEHGAVNIYAGQIVVARFTARSMLPELAEFKLDEQNHRAIFQAELQRRGLRRCRSYALCGVGGFVLGMVTALFGRNAMAATTVAVERVVLVHLKQQIEALRAQNESAVAAISAIVKEEQQHHDRSAAHVRASRYWVRVLSPIVALSTEAVIWVGMHA